MRVHAFLIYQKICGLRNNASLLRMLRNVGDYPVWGLAGCRFTSVETNKPMTTDCPMIDALMTDEGVISWEDACRVAASHSLYEDFIGDWWAKCCHNYDAGLSAEKLAYWLGY